MEREANECVESSTVRVFYHFRALQEVLERLSSLIRSP
jgi:hypothetical protein